MPVKPRKTTVSLAEFRRINNYSQRQAADLIPMGQATWSRIETGHAVPRPDLARLISDKTGVPVSTLISRYFTVQVA